MTQQPDPPADRLYTRERVVIFTALAMQWIAGKLCMYLLLSGPPSFRQDMTVPVACLTLGLQWFVIFWPGKFSGRFLAGFLYSLCTVPVMMFYYVNVAVMAYYHPARYAHLTVWDWLLTL